MKLISILSVLAIYLVALANCSNSSIKACGETPPSCVGDPCTVHKDCWTNLGDLTVCTFGVCTCPTAHTIVNPTGDKCLAIVNEIDGVCEDSVQCQAGRPGSLSTCLLKKCRCATDAVSGPGAHVCHKKATKLGDPCEIQDQCNQSPLGALSVCGIKKTCECNTLLSYKDDAAGVCVPYSSQVGSECIESKQCFNGVPGFFSDCKADPTPANPDRKTCQCQAGYVDSATFGCRPIKMNLGATCLHNAQCTAGPPGANSACLNASIWANPLQKTCQCKDKFINIPEKDGCVAIVEKVGLACDHSLQCTTTIGDLAECKGTGANRKCACMAGAVKSNDDTKCFPGGLSVGDPCVNAAQCPGGSGTTPTGTCTSVCDCVVDHVPQNDLMACLKTASIDDPCTESVQCWKGPAGPASVCGAGGKCECDQDSVHAVGKDMCLPKAKMVGDACVEDVQCFAGLGHALCINGNCTCNDGAILARNGDKCMARVNLGEECHMSEHHQCDHINGAICGMPDNSGKSKCQCDTGYITERNLLLVPVGCLKASAYVGDKCDDPKQCTALLEGAVCDQDKLVCVCGSPTDVVSANGRKCLPPVDKLGEAPCIESVQCTVEYSECRPAGNGNAPWLPRNCYCMEGFVSNNNDTHPLCLPVRSQVHQSCQDNIQCRGIDMDGQVTCENDQCQCPGGKELFNKYCVKGAKLFEECEFHDQCQLGVSSMSVCVAKNQSDPTGNKWCECVPSAKLMENNCWEVKGVGAPCSGTQECLAGIVTGNAKCSEVSGRCECVPGYRQDNSGFACDAGNSLQVTLFILVASLSALFMFK